MAICPSGRQVDPDYFSLRVRQALRSEFDELEPYPDDPLEVGDEPIDGGLCCDEFTDLATHPDVIEAGAAVVDAEAAVLAAEDAGVGDELAMRRLERARAAERAALVRLQKARTVAHTVRAESRPAQVVALRPRLSAIEGGEAA